MLCVFYTIKKCVVFLNNKTVFAQEVALAIDWVLFGVRLQAHRFLISPGSQRVANKPLHVRKIALDKKSRM